LNGRRIGHERLANARQAEQHVRGVGIHAGIPHAGFDDALEPVECRGQIAGLLIGERARDDRANVVFYG